MLTPVTDDGLSAFIGARSRLFGIAYRMLGSAVEAEDIVQDVWLRWQTADRSVVRDPPAFLVTATTRLAINHAQCARSRRETYVGPWLPEVIDTSADPGLGAERGEALQFAILMLLAALNRWRYGPALATGEERIVTIFRRVVMAEFVLIAVVLAVTAALTALFSTGA
jgi:hypothetical protein